MNPQLPAGAAPETQTAQLLDTLRIVARYRWQVAGMAALFAVLGTVAAFSATPIYRATLVVLIESQAERVAPIEEVYDPGFRSYEYYGTQMELLRSRDLAGRVVDRLGLANAQPPPGEQDKGFFSFAWLPFLGDEEAPVPEVIPPEVLREAAIYRVLGQLRVEMMPRTQLVRVHVESPSAAEAAALANAFGEAYVV
ncbi:MAG: Wzz/FepE/Etk N-terminal domain-containing protein, partial [Steroidobacteraceae bacterium]